MYISEIKVVQVWNHGYTEVYELHSGGRIKYVGQVADNKRSDISG